MIEFLRNGMKFECPFCQEKSISIWKKLCAFNWSYNCRCPKCEAVIKYYKAAHLIDFLVSIIILMIFIPFVLKTQTKNMFFVSILPVSILSVFNLTLLWFAKLRYRPDGKHPERIFKKEAQTLYGTMIFYVEDNVLYKKDYVIRVINQEQEVEFRITKESFTSSNTIDLVYNDDRQSIFRIFNHFVTLQTGEMTVSSSFNVS